MPKQPSNLVPFIPITLTEKQRDYAKAANSRILPDWAQADLKAASLGMEVSAWHLHAALDQALSSAATRNGQSTGRRILTEKIRHLIYKVDAVLEAHLAGLQPVEPGARSPRIAELEREAEQANRMIDEASEALGKAAQTVLDLQRESREVVERNASLTRQVADLKAERDSIDSRYHALLNYIGHVFEGPISARIQGFLDGRGWGAADAA